MGTFRDVQQFVRVSREVSDLESLRRCSEAATREFGMRYFLLSHHVNIRGPNTVRVGNYPEQWYQKMRTQSQFSADPVVRACQKTAAPFQWSELSRVTTLSAKQREILEGAGRAGLGEGFTVPIHIPGECTGSGSFAMRAGRALDASVMPALQFVACFAFEAARRLSLQVDRLTTSRADEPGLTQRQLDCIVLTAQGKSDWDVATILGISRRTVQEHIDTARRRYGVRSRMQLIIRTLFDNQVGFQDIIHA